MRDIDSISRGNALAKKKRETHYHAQLGLLCQNSGKKGLFVFKSRDLEPLDLLTCLVLGC